MNLLLHYYPGDAFSLAVVIVIVQITVVAAASLLLCRLVARRNAAVQYGICLVALGCVLAGPLVGWAAWQTDLSVVAIPIRPQEPSASASRESSVGAGHAEAPRGIAPAEPPGVSGKPARKIPGPPTGGTATVSSEGAPGVISDRQAHTPVPAAAQGPPVPDGQQAPPRWTLADRLRASFVIAAAAWSVGAFVLLVRLIYGIAVQSSLRRGARPAPGSLKALSRRASQYFRSKAMPAIAVSEAIRTPLSIGILRPMILLPAGLTETLEPDQLYDVLIHESAHALHRDHLIGLLQRIAQMLYWPHPLVHALNNYIGQAREGICDNHVLAGNDPHQYARVLLAVAEMANGRAMRFVPGLVQPHGMLERRVAGLLDERRKRMTKISGKTLGIVAVVLVASTLAVGGSRIVLREGRALASKGGPDKAPGSSTAGRGAGEKAKDQPSERIRLLVKALDDSDERVRKAAIAALADAASPHAVEPLIKLTSDPSSEIRHLAVDALSKMGDKRCFKAFMAALVDDDTRVRSAAARGLGKLADQRAVPALVSALIDDHEGVRGQASTALLEIGDPAAPPLAKLLSRGPSVRKRAAQLLVKMGTDKAKAQLAAAAKDDNWRVRLTVLEALSGVQDPPMDLVREALEDPNPRVQLRALNILSAQRHVAANMASLIKVLENKNVSVRRTAAQALRRFQDRRLVEPFCRLLSDSDLMVRRSAAYGLAQTANDKAVKALTAAMGDKDREVRQSVVMALAKIDSKEIAPALITALKDSDPAIRREAMKPLAKVAGKKAVKPLSGALHDKDAGVRTSAANALSQIGGKEAANALAAATKDSNLAVVVAAARGLIRIGGSESVEPLCRVLERVRKPGASADLRYLSSSIIAALGKMGDKRATPVILAALKDKWYPMRAAAAEALGNLADESTIDTLISALKDSGRDVRSAAALALGRTRSKRAAKPLLAATKDEHASVRSDAALALVMAAPDEAFEPYLAALKDRGRTPDHDLAEALQESGKKDVVDALIAALKSDKRTVRYEAASWLGRIGDKRAIKPLKGLANDRADNVAYMAKSALKKLQTGSRP